MTAAEALRKLRESRDGGLIFHDNGRTIAHLATVAGVRVEFVTCDLRTLTTQRREAGEGKR